MGAVNEESVSHARWDCTYHIVRIPKYRRKVLFQQSRREVGALLRQPFERRGLRGAGEQHLRRPRARLRAHTPEVRGGRRDGLREGEVRDGAEGPPPRVGGGGRQDKTFWARGYYVSTVGLNEETIRRYVAEQEEGSRFD